MRRLHATTLAGSCLLAALPSLAGEPAPSRLPDLALEELLEVRVSTASKYSQPVGEAPSSVTVITASEIRGFGWRTLAEILGGVRGLWVSEDHTYSFLGARGFGRPGDFNARVLVLVDGNRVNDNVFAGANLGTEFVLDVELIDRVEFVAGPGSAMYGGNALFGVVNVITRPPAASRSEVAVEAGSRPEHRARAVLAAQPLPGLSVVASASTYEARGRSRRYPEFDDALSPGGMAPAVLDRDRVDRAFVRADWGGWSAEVAQSVRKKGIPSASYGQVFGDPRARTDDDATLGSLRWAGQAFGDARAEVRAFAGDFRYAGRYVYDADPALNRDETLGRWWGLEARLWGTMPGGHRWVAGAEYQRNARQDQLNYDEPGGAAGFDDRRRSASTAVFVQDEWTAAPWLRLTAGLHIDPDGRGRRMAHPRFAAIWSPSTSTALKAIYGEAFRMPSAYERWYAFSPVSVANPDLRPEEIATWELVAEHRLGPGTAIVASAWRYRMEDLITLGVAPGGELQYQNLDRVRARGLEAGVEHRFAGGARLKASLAWQDAREDETGRWLDNSPRHLAKAQLLVPLAGERASVGLEVAYTGERRNYRDARVPAHAIANLSLATVTWPGGPELALTVRNLLDRRHADPASPEQYDSAGRVLGEIPRDGRTVLVTATFRF